MLDFFFQSSSIIILLYFSFHLNPKEIFTISSITFLFINDILSRYFIVFFFQFIFFISLLISFCNLMFHLHSFYAFFLFFYAFFLFLRHLLFYYFTFIPNIRKKKINDFFHQLPDVQCIEEECYICLENYTENSEKLKYLKCSHIFHANCLIEWFEIQSNKDFVCPVCKQKIFYE